MNNFKVVSVAEQDKTEVDRFLKQVYKPEKSAFLSQHRKWWYRGGQRHLAIVVDETRVAAHTAMIPTHILFNGQARDALWWVDLVVDPEFRGQGFQTLLDDQVRAAATLTFAFPARELSAKMFHKHGWVVSTACLHMMLPLHLTAFQRIRYTRGAKGTIARLASVFSAPASRIVRFYLSRYQPDTARVIQSPQAATLAEAFLRHNRQTNVVTTYRDAEFLQWRYLDAAYYDQLRFYIAGSAETPSHVVITRTHEWGGIKVTRILDVFGDFDDLKGLRDVLRLVIRDAVREGSIQVVAIASIAPLINSLRRLGFLFSRKLLFCWHTQVPTLRKTLEAEIWHWTFGDSDCDTP